MLFASGCRFLAGLLQGSICDYIFTDVIAGVREWRSCNRVLAYKAKSPSSLLLANLLVGVLYVHFKLVMCVPDKMLTPLACNCHAPSIDKGLAHSGKLPGGPWRHITRYHINDLLV